MEKDEENNQEIVEGIQKDATKIKATKSENAVSDDGKKAVYPVKYTFFVLKIKDKDGKTALHILADGFTFWIEDWRMETFVEVLKCLAVPTTIRIKDRNGKTALELMNRKWGKEVPEHYKDKFKEITNILSRNN